MEQTITPLPSPERSSGFAQAGQVLGHQVSGGHRKISAALATFAAGDTLGKDTLLWLWGLADGWLGGALGAMPETVATELIMLASLAVFYSTKEEAVQRPPAAAPLPSALPSAEPTQAEEPAA